MDEEGKLEAAYYRLQQENDYLRRRCEVLAAERDGYKAWYDKVIEMKVDILNTQLPKFIILKDGKLSVECDSIPPSPDSNRI